MSSQPIHAQRHSMTFADRAALVTKYGVPVMPLKPRSKDAFLNDWQHLATTDPAQIVKWEEKHPASNCASVGLTGGFWIFEVDNSTLFARIEEETGHSLDELDTLIVKSSGEKRHHYFKHDARSEAMGNFSSNDAEGEVFSVRAHNAYVVSPGSIHPTTGQPYEIVTEPTFDKIPTAPDWLMDWLLIEKAKPNGGTSNKTAAPPIPEIIPVHARNKTLTSMAGTMRRRNASESAILAALRVENAARCKPPLSDAELATIAGSVAKYPPAETHNPYAESGNSPPVGPDRWEPQDSPRAKAALEFHLPPVTGGTHRDWVFEPAPGMYEGLFPRGAVSLIAATSGGGKTTLMIQTLLAQRIHAPFLGHAASAGCDFVMLGADRGEQDHQRTMESMHLPLDAFQFKRIPMTAFDREAVQAIVDLIESITPMPEIIFVEGLDMMVTNVNDMHIVSPFLDGLQKVVERYHLALIGSVGSPKIKEGRGYTITRENILGSGAWGRGSATVITMQFPKGDDSTGRRVVKVLPRRAKSEKFTMEFQDGILVVVPDDPEETNTGDTLSKQTAAEIEWYQDMAQAGKTDAEKRWWTANDMARADTLNVSSRTARNHVDDALAKGYVILKPGKKTGRGGAHQYQWNEADSNPKWAKPSPDEGAF